MLLPVWICTKCRRSADVEDAFGNVLISDVCCYCCVVRLKLRKSRLLEDKKSSESSLVCQACFEKLLKKQLPSGYHGPTAKCILCRKILDADQCSQVRCQSEHQRQLRVWSCRDCFGKMRISGEQGIKNVGMITDIAS